MVVELLETRFEQDGAFAFATGRIRALEAKLLDHAKFQRMLDAADVAEAWRALAEAGYTQAAETPVENYENALNGELHALYELVTRLSPRPELTEWLARRYDFHHLKVYLKAKLLGEDPSEGVIAGVGVVPLKLLEAAVNTEVWSALLPELAVAGERAMREYQNTKLTQAIDTVIDIELFSYLKGATEGHCFLETLIAIWADLLNLKTLVRVKLMNKDRAFASRILVPAGSLDSAPALMEASLETWADELRHTAYSDVLSRGLAYLAERRSLALLEKLSDDFITAYLKRAKLTLYGTEPLVAYTLAKETELKNIRIIMIGKLNGVPKETLEERLRETYV